jgi:hypothetical protein
MYGVVRKYLIPPGSQRDALDRAEKKFIDVISAAPGFIAFHVVNEGEVAITITIFHSQAELEASVHHAEEFVRDHFSDLSRGPVEVIQGQVAISKIGSDPHYRGNY